MSMLFVSERYAQQEGEKEKEKEDSGREVGNVHSVTKAVRHEIFGDALLNCYLCRLV